MNDVDNVFRTRLTAFWLAVIVTLAALTPAHAAAQWEWTKGQGWSQGAGTPKATAAEQFQHAVALERRGEFRDAAKQYFLTVRAFPDTEEAGIALQRLAKCLYETESYFQAYQAIEQVIKSYPHTGRLTDLLGVEYKIGQRLLGGARISHLTEDPAEAARESRSAARQVFQSVFLRDPFGRYAPNALMGMGDASLLLSEPDKAIEHYERLLKEFPKSPLVARARLGIVRAKVVQGRADPTEVEHTAEQVRARRDAEGAALDQEEDDALEQGLRDLEEMEAKKMWDAAAFYQRRGTPESQRAWVFSLQELARRYPQSSYGERARKELTKVGEELPSERSRFVPDLSKVNIVPTFLRRDKDAPEFVTPQRGSEEVPTDVILEPVPGIQPPTNANSAAAATPAASPAVRPETSYAAPSPSPVPSPPGLEDRVTSDWRTDTGEMPSSVSTATVPEATPVIVPAPPSSDLPRIPEPAPSPGVVSPVDPAVPTPASTRRLPATGTSAVQPLTPGRHEIMEIGPVIRPEPAREGPIDRGEDAADRLPVVVTPDNDSSSSTAGIHPAVDRTRDAGVGAVESSPPPRPPVAPPVVTPSPVSPETTPAREDDSLAPGWELTDDF